jgi:hypothetical protein
MQRNAEKCREMQRNAEKYKQEVNMINSRRCAQNVADNTLNHTEAWQRIKACSLSTTSRTAAVAHRTYAKRGVEGVGGERHLHRIAAEGLVLLLPAGRTVHVRNLEQLDGPV